MECYGHFSDYIKIEEEDPTQHETLLVVSPGSLHMNMRIGKSHSEIDTSLLAGQWLAEQASVKVSVKKLTFK